MTRRDRTGCVAAGVGFAVLMLIGAPAMAAEINTSGLSVNGWFSDDTRADGTGTNPAGTNLISPTLTDAPENGGGSAAHDADINAQIQFGVATGVVPVGTFKGAMHLTIAPGVGAGKSQISHRKDDGLGHALGSVLGPGFTAEYSWMGDGTASVTASLKFGIKTSEFGSAGISSRTGENVWDKVLIYEPGNLNGQTSDGVWHTETIDWSTGKWWFFDRVTFSSTIGSPMTLEQMSTSALIVSGATTVQDIYNLMTSGGAHITSVQFGVGSGNAGASVYVNQLETSAYRSGDTTTFGAGPTVLTLQTAPCQTTTTVVVEVAMSNAQDLIVGGQFFLDYDNAILDFVSADAGDDPLDFEIFESVDEGAGTIDYSVGVDFGDVGTMSDTVMARLTFNVLVPDLCTPVADLVSFRPHTPPTRLTPISGLSIDPELVPLNLVSIDYTPPLITDAPADITLDCIEDADPGVLFGVGSGGVAVYYNDNGSGEIPTNQAYMKAQFDAATPGSGAPFVFDNVPLTGVPLSWQDIFSGLAWPESQFGFDAVIPAPTADGSVLPPVLNAWDNGDNTLGGRVLAGPVTWALNDYKPHAPDITAGDVLNSIIRSVSPGVPATDVAVTRADLSLSGTVFTLVLEGVLVADGVTHWFNPAFPDSPLSNLGLNGLFYFSGTLTYDTMTDVDPLMDFYVGSIAMTANYPSSATGILKAVDNCTLFPLVGFNDVVSGGTGCFGDPMTITRTWTATDDCGNVSTHVQTITIEDDAAPTFLSVPANLAGAAEAGLCTRTFTAAEIGFATAADGCDAGVAVTWSRSDGAGALDDPFSAFDSPITITWTATDACGNSTDAFQLVEIDDTTPLDVAVELDAAFGPLSITRCITFELFDCGVVTEVVTADLLFTSPDGATRAMAVATVDIPCGSYDCIGARDALHSLRIMDSDDFSIVGDIYVADFTAAGGGDELIAGNLNDDSFIDILDFGLFVGQFATNFGSGDTPCGTVGPHADVTGDGIVGVGDFTAIQIHFLNSAEADCCPPMPMSQRGQGEARSTRGLTTGRHAADRPVQRIAVTELRKRGLHDLAIADLNADGWLDSYDIVAFMHGARP